jgi:hypothetical protein
VASDGYGIPLGIASAGANRHDSPLPAPTLQAASRQLDHILPADRTCHLDRGYDSQPTRRVCPAPVSPVNAAKRWVLRLTRRSHEVVHDTGWAFIAADAGSAGPSALVDA